MAKSKVYYPTVTNDPHAPVVDQYGKVSRPQNNPQMQNPMQAYTNTTTSTTTSKTGTGKKTTSGTSKQTSSTATTIGNQTPYSWTNMETGTPYNPQAMYQVGQAYQPTAMYQVGQAYSPTSYYQAGTPLEWEDYQYTPQELLQLNENGLLNLDENALNRIKNEWGQSGYVDAVNSARQNSLDATNRQYDDNARNYYQQYMSNQNKLPEQLSRLGVTGGASETASLGLLNNYSGNLYGNESSRAQQVSNLNAQYDQLVADNSRQLAQSLIDTYLNMYNANKGENWNRESANNQGLNEANRYNNQGRNTVREANWNRTNEVNDRNVGLDNEAGLYNWQRGNTVADQNVDLLNQAGLYNWQRGNTVSDQNVDLLNQAGLTNWNWGNTVRQYNNQGQNETNQSNEGFNVDQMKTLQGYAQQEAQAQQERMYDVANYLLQNGGDASMLKTILGLSDSQAKALVKAWKKSQASGGSSGGSSGGGGYRGYYGGGSSISGGIDMSGYGQDNSGTTTEKNKNNKTKGNNTTNKTSDSKLEKKWNDNYRKYRNMVLQLAKNNSAGAVGNVKSTLTALVAGSQVSNAQLKNLWSLYNRYKGNTGNGTTAKKTTGKGGGGGHKVTNKNVSMKS